MEQIYSSNLRVAQQKPLTSEFVVKNHTGNTYSYEPTPKNDFAYAVYGDGPYNLNMPNQSSDILALNIDYIA